VVGSPSAAVFSVVVLVGKGAMNVHHPANTTAPVPSIFFVDENGLNMGVLLTSAILHRFKIDV
jgi:hypothetical protein